MPAMLITVRAKTREELKRKVEQQIREAAKKGLQYVMHGYSDSRVKKIKSGYEIEVSVHS
jgi:hypothetical protein